MDILFSPIRLNELEVLIEKSVEKALQKKQFSKEIKIDTQIDERLLDAKQAAEFFGVSTVSIWSWEKDKIIKSYRIGNLKRFKYSELLKSLTPIDRDVKKELNNELILLE